MAMPASSQSCCAVWAIAGAPASFAIASARRSFVGDFLDRGPEIRETLRLVRGMLEAGSALAVLGNHEWQRLRFSHSGPGPPR